jgi:soluble lytic murein transglycosylase-like protein
MTRPQSFLFPAVFTAVLAVVILTNLMSNVAVAEAFSDSQPQTVQKAPAAAPTKAAAPAQSGQNGCSLPTRYPQTIRQWCSLIENYARKTGLEARLVAAVILQESGGDARSYSSSGAVGLMLVMPRDGLAASFKCSGKPCFSSRPSMAELYDPEFNISYGTRMLAGLLEKRGSVREALFAYGPMDMGYRYADIVLAIYDRYQ